MCVIYFYVFVLHVSLEIFEPLIHFKAYLKKIVLKANLPSSISLRFLGNPLISIDILFCLHVGLLVCFINAVALKLTKIDFLKFFFQT